MEGAVKILDFESAAILRDEILELQKLLDSQTKKATAESEQWSYDQK